MAKGPFPGYLAEVAADAIVVRANDIDAEARGNCWSFSLSAEEAGVVTADDVCEFAVGVAAGRRAWLAARGEGPMRIYWWHDAQAGQLRFSLVSTSHGRWPFGRMVVAAPSLAAIVADWLASPHLNGIPWGEMTTGANAESQPEPEPVELPVWSEVLV